MTLRTHSLVTLVSVALGLAAATASFAQQTEAGPTPEATTVCTPVSAAEFVSRIHVRCSAAVSGIFYFAVSTSDPNRAARALALMSSALAAGHDLRIYYDPANVSGTAFGCAAADCRVADAIELL